MVKTPNADTGNKEIDLLELLLRAVIVVRDNFWLVVFFFLGGLALGFGFFFFSKKQFETKMIISSNILTTSYAKILFDNANAHLIEGDYDVLAKDLRLDVSEARQIASLQIENLTKAEGAELKESDRYLITARVFDQSILSKLQSGLINYLELNEFVKIRVDQQRTYLTQMLAATDRELADLQQFKADIASGKFFATAKGNVMFDPTSVNTKVLELTQKRIEFQNLLELINSVQLIEGFTPFKHHKKPSFLVSVVGGSFLGLFAVGLLIAFKSIRRLLRLAEANAPDAA
jgi:hypothetical protein